MRIFLQPEIQIIRKSLFFLFIQGEISVMGRMSHPALTIK
jgi:hypothetical protein